MNRENRVTDSFIKRICDLYGDTYDDMIEDSSIGGEDWAPGKRANHKSLKAFQEELDESGIHISTGKIRKILITGGKYSTELSRSVADAWMKNKAFPVSERRRKVAKELGISPNTVVSYLPYQRQVYNEDPSDNAKSIKRWRNKKKQKQLDVLDTDTLETLRKVKKIIGYDEMQKIMKTFISHPELMKLYLEKIKEE